MRGRSIRDERVLEAMSLVPRHMFVEEALHARAYEDNSLPIGQNQTISQPYIVALMSEALELTGVETVLEVGTGSGYQSAILSRLANTVFSVERVSRLAMKARRILDRLGVTNVRIKVADGSTGWPENAPYDAAIVAAASPSVPKSILSQVKEGGAMVIPIGSDSSQKLMKIVRGRESDCVSELTGCRFVKLIGNEGWKV